MQQKKHKGKKIKKNIAKFLLLLSVLFTACSDEYISQVHSRQILEKKITCLNLTISPSNFIFENALHEIYPFQKNCDLNLLVSYKESITCNSNQNSQQKALGMTSSYLRMELKKERQLLYSYYKDLKNDIRSEDLADAFKVIQKTFAFENQSR
jgi:hypothetical protein